MKLIVQTFLILLLITSCNSTINTIPKEKSKLPENAVRIANDSLEYEIIIIDIGFEAYLNSIARPANFYTQQYYETRNRLYVTEWNNRFQNPGNYDTSIYENRIDYNFNIDYGLDVNYKLYNYFKFVEYKYNQKF